MSTPSVNPVVSLFLQTFNCGKIPPFSHEFLLKLEAVFDSYTSSSTAPELLVFGFQELSTLLDGTTFNTINRILISLSNSIVEFLNVKFSGLQFDIVEINHNGSIGIILISSFRSRIKRIEKSVNVSVGYYFTNTKGATALRLLYSNANYGESAEFTFVVSHLNANEGIKYLLRRNQDLESIFKGIKFSDGFGVLKPSTHVFIMGDFNYRVTGAYGFSKDALVQVEAESNSAIDYADHYHFHKDELTLLRKQQVILKGFDEAPVKFNPTYKFKLGTSVYNPKRVPSWCDRILFLSYDPDLDGLPHPSQVKVVEYGSVDKLLISDHVPVYLKIEVPFAAPPSIINGKGYLVDPSTGFSDNSMYYKPWKQFDYYRKVGYVTDYVFGSVLYFTTTLKGRVFGIVALLLFFIAYNLWD